MSKLEIVRVRTKPGKHRTYEVSVDGRVLFDVSANEPAGMDAVTNILDAAAMVARALGAEVVR